jgi:hypothetical protein
MSVKRIVSVFVAQLYWQVGNRIKTDILQNKRVEYGQEIIKQLSVNLTEQFKAGVKNIWSHIKAILYIEDELKREFYIEEQIFPQEIWQIKKLSYLCRAFALFLGRYK